MILILLSCFFTITVGCREKDGANSPNEGKANSDDSVLARVNDSPITQKDLEQMARRAFGSDTPDKLDESNRKELLKSLVAARAIAIKAESGLTEKEKAEIENRTRAFREELLVQKYLGDHVRPEPVSEEMIREYYDSHPEEFGKKMNREYELITALRQESKEKDDRLLAEIDKAGSHKNWSEWTKKLAAKGFPVTYRQGTAEKDILDKRLYQLMESLKEGETSSSPTFIEGRLYVSRVTGINEVQPRSLEEVSERIRKKLAPLQVKDAVKKAADQVLKEVTVVYSGGNAGPKTQD